MENKLINTFVESRLKQVLINDLASYQVKDSNEAYNLQEIVNEKLSLSGLGEVIGYKIGCTNKSIQKELGVSHNKRSSARHRGTGGRTRRPFHRGH